MNKTMMIIFILVLSLQAPKTTNDNEQYFTQLSNRIWKSILNVETNNKHYRTNGRLVVNKESGAVGAAQLMTNTFIWVINNSKSYHLEVSDITNELINRWAGEYYWTYLFYDRCQTWKKAISSYNSGPNTDKFMTDYYTKVTNDITKNY